MSKSGHFSRISSDRQAPSGCTSKCIY